MLFSLALLALPVIAFAHPAPVNDNIAPVPAVTTYILAKRQSLPNEGAAIAGYGELLEEARIRVNGLDGECQRSCKNFLDVTDVCINLPTAERALTCQCTTETVIQMVECGDCLGDNQWHNAKSFQSFCIPVMSSLSAAGRSSTYIDSDPFNGFGTVTIGNDAVTIPTFDPTIDYFTRTSSLTGPVNGGDLPTTRTTRASGAEETQPVSGGEGQGTGDGAVALQVQGGLAVGAVGLVAVFFAL